MNIFKRLFGKKKKKEAPVRMFRPGGPTRIILDNPRQARKMSEDDVSRVSSYYTDRIREQDPSLLQGFLASTILTDNDAISPRQEPESQTEFGGGDFGGAGSGGSWESDSSSDSNSYDSGSSSDYGSSDSSSYDSGSSDSSSYSSSD